MPPDETPTKVYASGFWGSFWENDQPFRSIRARFSAPTFCSVSDSDIGNTFPFAQHTRTSEIPAPSIASKTAGRKLRGRSRAELVVDDHGDARLARERRTSAVDRLGECSARGLGRVADRPRLVGLHDRDEVRGGDLHLERVAVLLRLVVGRPDRERVHRLVRDDDAGGLAHRGLQRSVTLSPRARLVHSHARPHGSGTELAWHRGRRTRPGHRGRRVPGAGIHVRRDRRTVAQAIDARLPDPRRTGRRYRRVLGRRRVRALASAQRGVRPARRRARFESWDWVHAAPAGPRTLSPEGIVVVEGVCALHRMFRDYDVRVWVDAPYDVRLERGIARGRRGRAGDVGRALDPDGGALRRAGRPRLVRPRRRRRRRARG